VEPELCLTIFRKYKRACSIGGSAYHLARGLILALQSPLYRYYACVLLSAWFEWILKSPRFPSLEYDITKSGKPRY